jgi:hypothetical protein
VDAWLAHPRKVLITNAIICKVLIINNLAEPAFSCRFGVSSSATGTHFVAREAAFFRHFSAAAGRFRLSKSECRFDC